MLLQGQLDQEMHFQLLRHALRRMTAASDQDTKNLTDAALFAHSQLTHDVGSVMSAAMMIRRQIWLAQTSLPENIKRKFTNLPVVTVAPSSGPWLTLSLALQGRCARAPSTHANYRQSWKLFEACYN